MRYVLLTTTCLTVLLAGCSKSQSDQPYQPERYSTASNATAPANSVLAGAPPSRAITPSADIAPGVDVTAAPGVAFNYSYAFRLPAQNVKDAQEAHASACEKLGPQHCRITGMLYRLIGENNIVGAIQFKLDPALARTFGKQGIDAIVKADGKLVDAEITGTDAGAAIKTLDVQRQQAEAELQRLDRELARGDLKAAERSELQSQRAALAARLQEVKTETGNQEQSLAHSGKLPLRIRRGSPRLRWQRADHQRGQYLSRFGAGDARRRPDRIRRTGPARRNPADRLPALAPLPPTPRRCADRGVIAPEQSFRYRPSLPAPARHSRCRGAHFTKVSAEYGTPPPDLRRQSQDPL